MNTHSHKVQIQRRAVFLDRDGTLIEEVGYLRRVEDIRWLSGVPDALRMLQDHGFALVVVSNQSGIARGLLTWSDLHAIEDAMRFDLERVGVSLAGWYYCPHLPEVDGPCACRKPANGLLERALDELDLVRAGSWMVGDSLRDAEAGARSGLRCALVDSGHPIPQELVPKNVPIYAGLMDFVNAVLKEELLI